MTPLRIAQVLAVARLEMKKTFFAKRGLWIYLLAFAPVVLFLAHSLVEINRHGARQHMASKSARPLTEQSFAAISAGMSREQVVAALGDPPEVRTRMTRRRKGRDINLA